MSAVGMIGNFQYLTPIATLAVDRSVCACICACVRALTCVKSDLEMILHRVSWMMLYSFWIT